MALILDGLTKTFSSFPAVNNLSYTMDTGVYGLLGVNGAGKTTLMRMLCTLLTPTSGTITWDGQDIFSLGSAYRNLLGYLPQDFGYYPDFSVQDYLLYIASIKGLRPATARQRMQNLLEQVGLTQVRRQKMKKLHRKYLRGKMTFADIYATWQSWRSYAARFNAWHTVQNMGALYTNLFINSKEDCYGLLQNPVC